MFNIVNKVTRTRHQHTSITTIGITDFPTPRSTADTPWLYANKKNRTSHNELVLHHIVLLLDHQQINALME